MRKPRPRFSADSRREGFTLIEVMLAVAMLVLLAGGLFGTVRGTIQAAAALRDAQREHATVAGLFHLCQQTFSLLPSAATLTWINRGEGSSLPEVALRNAPAAFTVGDRDVFFGESALVTRHQDDGDLALGIEYRRLDPQTNQPFRQPPPLWLPLASGLESVTWTFYDAQTGQWQDFWSDAARHPTLIRLKIRFPGDSRDWAETFWLPKLAAAPNPAQQPAGSPAPVQPSLP